MKSLKLLSAAILASTAFAAMAADPFDASRATISGLKRSPSLPRIYGPGSAVGEGDRPAELANSITKHKGNVTTARAGLPVPKAAPADFTFGEAEARAALTKAFGTDASTVILFNDSGTWVAGKLKADGKSIEKADDGTFKIGKKAYKAADDEGVLVDQGNAAIAAALALAKAEHDKAAGEVAAHNKTRGELEAQLAAIDLELDSHSGKHAEYQARFGADAAAAKLDTALAAAGVTATKKADLTGKNAGAIALISGADETVLAAMVGILNDLIGVDPAILKENARIIQDLQDELEGEKEDGKANKKALILLRAQLEAATKAAATTTAPSAFDAKKLTRSASPSKLAYEGVDLGQVSALGLTPGIPPFGGTGNDSAAPKKGQKEYFGEDEEGNQIYKTWNGTNWE